MAITLPTFAGGDQNYIGKMNQTNALVEAELNSFRVALQGGNLAAVNNAVFMKAIAGGVTARIGGNSYKPSTLGSTLKIGPGAAYLSTTQEVVQSGITTNLSYTGVPGGTYYVEVSSGGPSHTTTFGANVLYSVEWTGSTFGEITPIAPALFDAKEEQAIRDGDVIRKVGCSGRNALGVVGTPIQVDFSGVIVGWSLMCDQPGNIEIAVSKVTGLAPPNDPPIPDAVLDRISGSFPIEIDDPSGAQSAAQGEEGVADWTTVIVNQWDSFQFDVVSVSGFITKFTAYLRIRQSSQG